MRIRSNIFAFRLAPLALLLGCSLALGASIQQEPDFSATDQRSSGPTLTLIPDYRSTPESVVDLRGATSEHGAVHISSSLRWDEILIVAGRNEHVAKRPAPPPVLQSIPVTGAVSALAMGDLDSDGFMDFAAADFVDGWVYIYVGDACAQFRRAGSVRVGAGPARLLLEDFDGDGDVDIATANLLDRTISTAMGLGGARFGGALTRAASRELAASPIFELRASAAVDYTAIKSAVATTGMGEGLRRRLQSYLARSERAYRTGKLRPAISGIERFIRVLTASSDRVLNDRDRRSLITIARNLIADIINTPKVTVAISGDPQVISPGGSSTLTWSSVGAVSAWINNGVGEVPASGSKTVQPAGTTTYTIVVTAAGGSTGSASTTVTVGDADTIYVDVHRGDDSKGDGTAGKPYQSITKGLSKAASGKTIAIAQGAYTGSVETFPLIIPAGVTLRGAGGTKTLVEGNGPAPFQTTALILNDGVTLDGMAIVNPAGSGVHAGDSNITLTNCVFSGCKRGVYAEGGHATITQSDISDSKNFGILIAYDQSATVSASVLRDNSYSALATYYSEHASQPTTVVGSQITNKANQGDWGSLYLYSAPVVAVSDSSFFCRTTVPPNRLGGIGVKMEMGSHGTISGNQFSGGYRCGIYVSKSTADITANTMKDLSHGIYLLSSSSAACVGNTITSFYYGLPYGPFPGDTGALRVESGASGVFRGNTVTGGTVDTAGRPVGVFVQSTAGTADFGTPASPGGNSFTSLLDAGHASSNLRNNKATAVDAVGNTWLNPIPTVVAGPVHGFDIQTNPGTVNY